LRLLTLALALLAADPSADAHLLAGAERFRDGRFAEALVEFEVAQKLGAKEARWYVAASRVKLSDPVGAMEDFAAAEKEAPGEADAVTSYYRALACYGLQLYACADKYLAGSQGQVGPRMGALVQTLRDRLAPVLKEAPATGTIDLYLSRGEDDAKAGHAAVAEAEFDEAEKLSERRPDHHRQTEALAALARLHQGSPGTP
jgi:hypothetical protein